MGLKERVFLAIINPEGLFAGERLARCSDAAQLHWVRLFVASNTFARLELSYQNLIGAAYRSFHVKPTEAELAGWVQEYFDNFLLFVFEAGDGSTWGQWLTSAELLSRYHTAADRRSPAPDEKAIEEYRQKYVRTKQRKSIKIKTNSKPRKTIPIHTLGIGIGVGEGKEQKTSRAKAARVKTEPTKTDLAKSRHADFKAAVGKYWDHKNPGIQMPWDGREGKHLEMFLRAAPQITLPQFRGFLNNRAESEVNHGERPSQWIDWVTSYSAGPMDKFGKTIGGTNGANHISPTKQRVAANLAALGEAAKRRGLGPLDGFGGADAPALPIARPDGLSGGPDQGLRSAGPEILPPEG